MGRRLTFIEGQRRHSRVDGADRYRPERIAGVVLVRVDPRAEQGVAALASVPIPSGGEHPPSDCPIPPGCRLLTHSLGLQFMSRARLPKQDGRSPAPEGAGVIAEVKGRKNRGPVLGLFALIVARIVAGSNDDTFSLGQLYT